MPIPRKPHAFTLLELIVTIVIIAVLAAIAVPTFNQVIIRTQDEKGVTELSALAREKTAEAAFEQGPAGVPVAAFLDTGTSGAYGTGIHAASAPLRSVAYDTAHGGQASYTPAERANGALMAERLGMVSHQNGLFSVAADATTALRFGLAMRSEYSGHCVLVTYQSGTRTATEIREYTSSGPDACAGRVALDLPPNGGGGGGGGGGTVVVDPPHDEIAVVNPIPTRGFPRDTGDSPRSTNPEQPKTVVTKEPVQGGTPSRYTSAPAAAVASFPSGHATGLHHIYVLLADGALIDVVDDGTCAATTSCERKVIHPAGTFPGGKSLIAGGRPETSGTNGTGALRYDTLYVGDANGNVWLAPSNGTSWGRPYRIARDLPLTGGVTGLTYAGCVDGTGTTTIEHCVYAAGGNSWYQVESSSEEKVYNNPTAPIQVNLPAGYSTIRAIAPVEHSDTLAFAVAATDSSGTGRLLIVGGRGELRDVQAGTVNPGGITTHGKDLVLGNAGGGIETRTSTGTTTTPTSAGVTAVHNHGIAGVQYAVEADGCVHRVTPSSDQAMLCELNSATVEEVRGTAAVGSGDGASILYYGKKDGVTGILRQDVSSSCGYTSECTTLTPLGTLPESSVLGGFTPTQNVATTDDSVVAVHTQRGADDYWAYTLQAELLDPANGDRTPLGTIGAGYESWDPNGTTRHSNVKVTTCFTSDGRAEPGTTCIYVVEQTYANMTHPDGRTMLLRYRVTSGALGAREVLNADLNAGLNEWQARSTYGARITGVGYHAGRPHVALREGYGTTYLDAVTGERTSVPDSGRIPEGGTAVNGEYTAVVSTQPGAVDFYTAADLVALQDEGGNVYHTYYQRNRTVRIPLDPAHSDVTAGPDGKFVVRAMERDSQYRLYGGVYLVDPATGETVKLVDIPRLPEPPPNDGALG